jgi:hypothetical protein
MSSSLRNDYYSPRQNLLLGLGSTAFFAVSVTNCIVYGGALGSGSRTSSANTTNNNTGIDTTCAWIMLALNIVFAFISFIFMVTFLYRWGRSTTREVGQYYDRVTRPNTERVSEVVTRTVDNRGYGPVNSEYTVPVGIPVGVPVGKPLIYDARTGRYT